MGTGNQGNGQVIALGNLYRDDSIEGRSKLTEVTFNEETQFIPILC